MARPWEDTIVMALRDSQWMLNHENNSMAPSFPSLFLKLDGPTEQNLGDLVFQEGERFYLFEVKSSKAGIRSEWNKVVKGEPHRKMAFEILADLANKMDRSRRSEALASAFWTSLRCHHFVYCSDRMFDPNDTFGNIMVEPYISGCIRLGAAKGNAVSKMPSFEPPFETAQENGKGQLLIGPMLPFSIIRRRSGFVTLLNEKGAVRKDCLAPIGESLERFKEYLRFLVDAGGVGDGRIHAVICSDTGRFVKVVKSIEALGDELTATGAKPPINFTKLSRKSISCPADMPALRAGLPVIRPAFPSLKPTIGKPNRFGIK